MEGASPLNEMDWKEFRSTLRKNFRKRLKCCKGYHKSQLTIEDNLSNSWNLEVLVHQKYVLQGALNFFDGNVAQAAKLFRQAIRFCPEKLPVWLYLASALYRLERYQEVINLVEKYCRDHRGNFFMLLIPNIPPRKFVFSLYSQFSYYLKAVLSKTSSNLLIPFL